MLSTAFECPIISLNLKSINLIYDIIGTLLHTYFHNLIVTHIRMYSLNFFLVIGLYLFWSHHACNYGVS